MPVPKQRVGHSDQGHRRSNWKATVPTVSICKNCGAPRLSHRMCGVCGFYKDRIVTEKFAKAAAAADKHSHEGHDHSHEGHDHD